MNRPDVEAIRKRAEAFTQDNKRGLWLAVLSAIRTAEDVPELCDYITRLEARVAELEAIMELSDELAYATGALVRNDGTPRDPKGR